MPANSLGDFIPHIVGFARWRAAYVLAAMIVAALSEGVGLLLLIPMLALVGLGSVTATDGIALRVSDIVATAGLELNLTLVTVAFVALIALRQGMVYLSKSMLETMRIDYVNHLRKSMFDAIGQSLWRSPEPARNSKLGQAILMDGWRAGEAVVNLYRTVSAIIIIAVNTAVALLISPPLALVVCLALVMLVALSRRRLVQPGSRGARVTAVQEEIYAAVENYLENLRLATLAGAEDKIRRRFARTLDELADEMTGFVRSAIAAGVTLQLGAAVSLAVFVWFAARFSGAAGPEMLVVVFIAARLIPHYVTYSQAVQHTYYHLPAFSNALSAMQPAGATPEPDVPVERGPPPRSTIGMEDVSLWSPEQPDRAILRDITFSIRPGETVAITGPSGAGKSTLADVLAGMLPPDDGCLNIDGVPLNSRSVIGWRRCVGYVPQSSGLLNGTLRENLTWLLQVEPNADEISRALACVHADDLILRLPDGLETIIESREGRLSGGERQRIAIARELLRAPDLLILDEATSALDPGAEAEVLASIRKSFPALMVVVISHRDSAHARADHILLVEAGCLEAASRTQSPHPGDGDEQLPGVFHA